MVKGVAFGEEMRACSNEVAFEGSRVWRRNENL
jgi:hypothetical protein